MRTPKLKLLFLCCHNHCGSILAEAICRHLAGDMIEARSAGKKPSGTIHPLALRHLAAAGISTRHLYSKSWDENELADFTPDAVISICGQAIDELYPRWLGSTRKIDWSLPDPGTDTSNLKRAEKNFHHAIATLELRLDIFARCLRRGVLYCDSLLLLDQFATTYPEACPLCVTLTPPRVLYAEPLAWQG
ncbi:MAG: arsenate reductase ArsC [Pseudomonadales bacterium]|jgi:arsenate reductase|nr:arsenate reductase ArsC [Pseudomonadales bacterium]